MTVEGIDVSTYQTTTPSLANLGFAIARATYGTAGEDARYAMHSANIRKAGLVLGAYHYWYSGDGATQARLLLSVAGTADLLFIDLEGPDEATDTAHAQVRDMIATIHAAGRKVGLYHSESGYPSLGQDYRWVAHWGVTAPAIPWDFHQYQGSPLDRDHWRGDLASLRALVSGQSGGSTMTMYLVTPETGTVAIAAGFSTHGLAVGDPWSIVNSVAGPATFHYDQIAHRVAGTATPSVAVHCTDGALAGLWLGIGGTNVVRTPDPIQPALTQADLDAAKAAGFDQAKTAAVAAVQSI